MEVVAALAVLSVMLGSVMVLMNRYVEAVMDLQLREQAFEIVRGNMENLLAESKLSDMGEFGTSETNPDIEWKTLVEPFYESVTNRMWIRAVCSAGFNDSKGEYQEVELEHWITNLTAVQIKRILAQQEVENEYMELLNDGEDSAIQETTRAYLLEQGLDADAYDRFAKQQQRKKLEYITKNGFDGYDEFVEMLKEEENIFLEELGMDFGEYNDFADVYVPKTRAEDPFSPDAENPFDPTLDIDDPFDESPDEIEPDSPKKPDERESEQPKKKIYTAEDLRGMGVPEKNIPIFLAIFNQ
ncbi:MAG: hypothetical protein ACYSTR_06705 [Planctomycetota bacterium]